MILVIWVVFSGLLSCRSALRWGCATYLSSVARPINDDPTCQCTSLECSPRLALPSEFCGQSGRVAFLWLCYVGMTSSLLYNLLCFGCFSRLLRFCVVRRRRWLVVLAGVLAGLTVPSLVALLILNTIQVMRENHLQESLGVTKHMRSDSEGSASLS